MHHLTSFIGHEKNAPKPGIQTCNNISVTNNVLPLVHKKSSIILILDQNNGRLFMERSLYIIIGFMMLTPDVYV